MPTLDPVKNLAVVVVSTGYSDTDTSIVLQTGDGSKLPDPSGDGAYNLCWYNATDYPAVFDDPNVEIVRVTARSTDTLTVTRAQEGTSASTKNTGGKTYKMVLAPTKKLRDDLETALGATFVTISSSTPLANERVLTGTANQVTITDNGAGSTVVLSLPQNIHTSATPTFGGLIVNGDIGVTADTDLLGLAANALTIRGSVTASNAGVVLDIQNTTNAASNQVAIFRANDRTTAVNNDEGYFSFHNETSTGVSAEFARMTWIAPDVTNASKNGIIRFEVMSQDSFGINKGLTISGAVSEDDSKIRVGVNVASPSYALDVNGDIVSTTNGGIAVGSTSAGTSNWFSIARDITHTTNSAYNIGGGTGVGFTGAFGNKIGTFANISAGYSYSRFLLADATVNEAGSGNHPLITQLAIKPLTITGGSATVSNTAMLYIESAMSATVSGVNYAVWIDAGVCRFDGNVGFGGTANAAYPVDITGNARLTGDLYVDGGDIGTTSDTDLIGLAANTVTVRGEGIFTTDLSVRSKKMQSFVLTVTNTSGTIQHRIGAAGSQGQTPTMAGKISGASGTLANTPQSTSDFVSGCALLSSGNEAIIFNTDTMDTNVHIGCVSVVYNDTGTDVLPEPNIASRTVNSVSKTRLELIFRNATSGAVWPLNTSNIADGKQVRVAVFYTIT